jgi:hypothetical protein
VGDGEAGISEAGGDDVTGMSSAASDNNVGVGDGSCLELKVTQHRRVRIVYRGLGRAFLVHKNRDLEGKTFSRHLVLYSYVC